MVQQVGGLGVISVTSQEDKKIAELQSIVSGNGAKCFINQDCDHTSRYRTLMNDLFPAFMTTDSRVLRPFYRNNTLYRGLGRAKEIVIENNFPISRVIGQQEVELRIITPQERREYEYYMGVVLHASYQPDCVDDIVQILGGREKPTYTPAQLIQMQAEDSTRPLHYSIADVPRLGLVTGTYQRVEALVRLAPKAVGASLNQLNILRRDAKEHENLAVRELSHSRYVQLLDKLTFV